MNLNYYNSIFYQRVFRESLSKEYSVYTTLGYESYPSQVKESTKDDRDNLRAQIWRSRMGWRDRNVDYWINNGLSGNWKTYG